MLTLFASTRNWPPVKTGCGLKSLHLGPYPLAVVSVAKIEGRLEVRSVAALTGVDALVAPLSCRALLSGIDRHGLLLFWRNLKCVQNGSKRVARCHWYFSYGAFKSMAERVGFEPTVELPPAHALRGDDVFLLVGLEDHIQAVS
jgi:hypothetical protein